MKLPSLRRRTDPEPAESASAIPAAPALLVEAYSRTGLPDKEFSGQTEALRSILSYDGDTRSWYARLPLDHLDQAAGVLTALFEVARVHGTTVQVRVQPAGEGSQPAAGPS